MIGVFKHARSMERHRCTRQTVDSGCGRAFNGINEKALIIETKSNAADLVTNMDREIEQFLIGKIKETFPHHHILGEEGYGDEVTSSDGVVWLMIQLTAR